MDPDHNRSVVTALGSERAVEAGSVAAARLALDCIDMRGHAGVHPRIGALDVLPLVPLAGISMDAAVALSRRVGAGIARLGIPVYMYGCSSVPPGRGLAELRRGGFEALADGLVGQRAPADHEGHDPGGRDRFRVCHPTAGAACVGARPVLLAWNVDIVGVSMGVARGIAAGIREAGGGFLGLRAMALELPKQKRTQISMNLEDAALARPMDVFQAIERRVRRHGGAVAGVEIIGMIPDSISAADAQRMGVRDFSGDRILSRRVQRYWSALAARG